LRPAWGKLEAYLARLALILAMARVGERSDEKQWIDEKVTRGDVEGAARLLGYFKNHARRVYTGLYGENQSDKLAADLTDFLQREGGVWEGTASELHEALDSDHKPERPEDLAKAVRAIEKRSPLLLLEDLKRSPQRRSFRLSLRNAVIAVSAVMPSSQDGSEDEEVIEF
jgi:putative DNA primase/helicase